MSNELGILATLLWKKIGKTVTILSTGKEADNSFFYLRSSAFCPRAGPSLQTQATRLQFCPKAGLRLQTHEPRLQFY